MATQQMQPMEAAQEDDGSYVICINVGGDGSLSVSVDSAAAEAAEPPEQEAMEAEEEDAQPVADIREAIKLVLDIYKNAGAKTDAGMEKQEMEAGYK
jgi:hypothetical protein